MALKSIRVLTQGALYTVATLGAPKVKDLRTGEIATHYQTGEPLHTVSLLEMADGAADLLKVTVPASKIPKDLRLGVQVRPIGLTASPWARVSNDQLSDGVAYRADSIEMENTK
ncbi:hypothetical protein [Streptomyces sp. MBT27]|uniref:SCO3933 family regulatory protein n=1 Tax=Streptomyces sp. MBT27 TaxID=1488356 RepID=UPI001420F9C0|nr:hypothetical protein [Streptomyces sp. MBT27]